MSISDEARQLMRRPAVRRALISAGGLAVAAVLLALVVVVPPHLIGTTGDMGQKDRLDAANDLRATLLQAIAGALLLGGLYVSISTLRISARTLELNREGQITERFTRAIDQLGNTGSLDVRLGGIYALERIARDSETDQGPIMEVLTAFVVRQSRASGEGASPPPDVQAAVTVLGRRNPLHAPDRELNLTGARLERVHLTGAHLERAILRGAYLKGAHLRRAHLEGADLRGVNLERAILRGVHLEKADLRRTRLEGADLRRARLAGADLSEAHLKGADLSGADLKGTRLIGADVEEVQFIGADLSGADLHEARLRGADLSGASLEGARLPPPGGDEMPPTSGETCPS